MKKITRLITALMLAAFLALSTITAFAAPVYGEPICDDPFPMQALGVKIGDEWEED